MLYMHLFYVKTFQTPWYVFAAFVIQIHPHGEPPPTPQGSHRLLLWPPTMIILSHMPVGLFNEPLLPTLDPEH